jgi:hypothetical protein
VVDVGDTVDDAHDLSFERCRLARAGVREDAVADLLGQVQLPRDPLGLLVVAEAAPEGLAQATVELVLTGMAERRVAHVVPEADRLRQVLVQAQRARDHARDPRRLERVRHARSVVVAGRVDEDLRLLLEPAEGLRVEDPIAVALERCAQAALLLGSRPAARLVGAHGER